MGNHLIERILWHTPPLTDVPFKTLHCLLLMASRAHDKTGLYFAGIEWLQLQLGYQMNKGGYVHTMRHIRALEKAGYVRRTGQMRGRKHVYQVSIPGQLDPVDNPHRPPWLP